MKINSEKILDDLAEYEKLTDHEEKRKALLVRLKTIQKIYHPDKSAKTDEEYAKKLFQDKIRPDVNSYTKFLNDHKGVSNLEKPEKPSIFSHAKYQEIIDHMEAYAKETKWWFTRWFTSESKDWKKLQKKAAKLLHGSSEKDIEDIQKLLQLKNDGLEIPRSFEMDFLKRKIDEYSELVKNEVELIDNYVYHYVERKGNKIYKSRNWENLQRLMEERHELLTTIDDYVSHTSPKPDGTMENRLREAEYKNHYFRTTGLYYIAGSFLLLAVLAWLKHTGKLNRPQVEYEDNYDPDMLGDDENDMFLGDDRGSFIGGDYKITDQDFDDSISSHVQRNHDGKLRNDRGRYNGDYKVTDQDFDDISSSHGQEK